MSEFIFLGGLEGVGQDCDSSDPLDAPKRPRREAETCCKKHRLTLDVYCCTDEQLICSQCASAEHRGHSFGLVENERSIKQVKLRSLQAQYREIVQKHEKSQQEYKKLLYNISDQAREAEDTSEGAIICVIDALQSHFRSLRERIRGQEEASAARVNRLCRYLPAKLKIMRRREAELKRLAETQCNAHFLQQWPSLRRLCEKELQQDCQEVSQDPLLPFKRLKDAVWQLRETLEEFCDQEFTSLSQSALPPVHSGLGPNTQPTTREQFLQHACHVSLDPDTAHEDLTVSDGDKKVKVEKARGPVPPNPERFVMRRQVLCREGLQAERCYFEVEVLGDKAEIALAYKGINRSSGSYLSALGGNEKSWSLDISSTYSVSHNRDSVQLLARRRQRRIGVYLQFQEGALSFYEVSDEMKFLYKVKAEFKEPLYPAFCLGDRGCITICS